MTLSKRRWDDTIQHAVFDLGREMSRQQVAQDRPKWKHIDVSFARRVTRTRREAQALWFRV